MENTPPKSANLVTMQPSGNQFEIVGESSLLESGLVANVALPFGCANGSCGDCRARVVSGSVSRIKHHDFTLTNAQKLDGQCLLCSYTGTSDVVIEVFEAQSVVDIPHQQLQAKRCRSEQMDDVNIVTLKFARGKALRFLPGQCITIDVDSQYSVTLPIASCPCDAQIVELHLFNTIGSDNSCEHESDKLLQKLTGKKSLTLSGPTGAFTLSKNAAKPKLFIAIGSDFSALKSMIEQVLNQDNGVPCCLIWQSTDRISQYRANLCRSWHDAFDEFTYLPLNLNDNLISKIQNSWEIGLGGCEVYLARGYDNQLSSKLINAGVQQEDIYYPIENFAL